MNSESLPRLYVRLILILALIVGAGLILWQNSRPPANAKPGVTRQSPIPLGLDLRGGTELRYRIVTERLSETQKRNVVEQTIAVIRKRIDPEGRLECDIRPAGEYRFYIQLPGLGPDESRRIEDLIRKAGQLRFHLINEDEADCAAARRGEMVPGCTPFVPQYNASDVVTSWRRGTYEELAKLKETERWYLVENTVRLTGADLTYPHPTTENGIPAVGFSFKGKGRIEFETLTDEFKRVGDRPGRQLAIILDEELYSAPEIRNRISGDGVISGKFTRQQVEDLVSVLRAGQLPADIELEWNNTVGAQLGEDSIRSGLRSCLVASILVLAFMAVYYFLTGMLANFAVALNVLFVLAAMSAMQSVLTLPGLAGLVLTVGMAVDANVLINERIREEMDRGKGLRLAIRAGYERAFVTIVDSNLTTLIAGIILFGIGSGPVRGFAVTLCLGIITSVATSVWVTRWILETMVEKGWVNSLRMMRLLTKPNIAFSKVRFLCIGGSIICIVAGLAIFFGRGRDILDTDLTGGFRAEMELTKGVSIDEFRARVSKVFKKSDVQSIWNVSDKSDALPTRFSIRVQELSDEQKIIKIQSDLVQMLRADGDSGTVKAPAEGEGWQFKLKLSQARSAEAMLALLSRERYTEATINNLILEGKESTEFIIRPTAAALEKEPDAQIGKIVDALKASIVSQGIRVTMGEVQIERTDSGRDSVSRGSLTLKLGQPASITAVREALIKEALGGVRPDDLRVSGSGADSGEESAREMIVRGKASDLETIKGYSRKEGLPVYSFAMPKSDSVSVSLKMKMSETALRAKLDEAKVLSLVQSVIPVGVEGTDFLLTTNGLSEDKAAEKIREQLEAEFAPELQVQAGGKALTVKTEASEAPEFVANAKEQAEQGYKFYKVETSAPVQLQFIHERLRRARMADTLLVQGDINSSKVASQQVSEVYLKLKGSPQQIESAVEKARNAIQTHEAFRSVEAIGALVANEIKTKAVLAIVLSWIAMIIYLWVRFGEVKFGLGAVIALIHDVLFTLGAVGVADALSQTPVGHWLGFSDIKVNITMIAAFLTLVGYSVNDTIVVFDRIRENMGGVKRRLDANLVDMSVNQTLSRTLLTSFTVFLVLIVLYLTGGSVIHGFAFVMLFGVFVGTYSSVFIAAPILIGWENMVSRLRKLF